MGVEIEFNAKRRFLCARLIGEQTATDFRNAYESVHAHPDYRPGMNRIWDLREGTLKGLTGNDILRMGSVSAQHEPAGSGARLAVVVSEEVDDDLKQIGESLNEEVLTVDMKVFRDMAEAEHWVSAGG